MDGAPPTRRCVGCGAVPSAFQAACVDIAMWGLYAGRCKDYDRVRGGKFCMCEALRYLPTGWKSDRPTVKSMKRAWEEKDNLDDDFPLAKRAA